jgi:cytochrome b
MITQLSKRMMSWDAAVMVSHWLLAICFLGAIITQDSERFRMVHVTMGYTMFGLVAFRLIWGFVGGKYTRFSAIYPRVKKVIEYLRSLLTAEPQAFIGFHSIGFLAAYLLLAVILLVTVSGYFVFEEIGPDLFEDLHEALGNLLIAIVAIHIGCVVISALIQKVKLSIAAHANNSASHGAPSSIKRVRPFKWMAAIILLSVTYFWVIQIKA